MMENKQPLVSVNVLMYNSSKYILETLESIKAQTYQNIELIMSDDKSTDNTVQICEDWISLNKDRFVGYKILVPEANTGQSGNYNRAFRAATGEWIKEIDGDDLLLPNCLTDLVEYVYENPEAKYVFGNLKYFRDTEKGKVFTNTEYNPAFFSKTKEEQMELMLEGNPLPSPTSFYNRQLMVDIGFKNDERIPNMEDLPKWINLTKKGIHFSFFNRHVVHYRLGSGISTQHRDSLRYYKSLRLFDFYYRYPIWLERNEGNAVIRMVEQNCRIYEQLLETEKCLQKIQSNVFYRFLRSIYLLVK